MHAKQILVMIVYLNKGQQQQNTIKKTLFHSCPKNMDTVDALTSVKWLESEMVTLLRAMFFFFGQF